MLSELIGGGLKLLSGFMNQNAQENANATNQANWQTSMAYQDLVNKNQIQWKVADAKAAGLHPLAALGASTASGPASFVGANAETGLGDAVGSMGSDISRAINVSRTQKERLVAFENSARSLDLENKGLQNEVLRARLAQINANNNPPAPGDPYLVEGQTQSGIKDKAMERAPGAEGAPHQEQGAITDTGYVRTPTGWAPTPSNDVKQRIEDNFVQERLWDIRNNLLPSMGRSMSPPRHVELPPNTHWRFNPFKQEYQIVPDGASGFDYPGYVYKRR